MEQEEVAHLAKLARIKVTDEEALSLTNDLNEIMGYVSTIQNIAAAEAEEKPEVGPLHNVFRKDEVTNQPDQYTREILEEMPKTEGRHMVVKRILNAD